MKSPALDSTAALSDRGELSPQQALAQNGTERVYAEHFDFVWRNLKRLGVAPTLLDDAAQDVFVAFHRKWGEFEHRCSLRTWLFGITLRVASDYRRSFRRRSLRISQREGPEADEIPTPAPGPDVIAERHEASELFHRALGHLDDKKRAIFLMVELEQMSVVEAAKALEVNLNTAHARLRAARKAFERAVTWERRKGSSYE